MDKDDILIIAGVSFCVIGLLVITAVSFTGWWCYVTRKDKQRRNQANRKMEHLKYLEEYSIRTEDEEEEEERNNLSTPQITPRSNHSHTQGSDGDASMSVDGGGYAMDWEHVQHSTSCEASNASSVLAAHKSSTQHNNNNVYDTGAYDNVHPEHGTNLDDVRL